MSKEIKKIPPLSDEVIGNLKADIAQLESAISEIKQQLSSFEKEIHLKLDMLISKINSLTQKVKEKKALKKAKRLAQKKRGKNYKEPVHLLNQKSESLPLLANNETKNLELKRLFKSAIVHVHPDKIGENADADQILIANALTAKLNGIYKNGDLEALLDFFQCYILGNASEQETQKTIPEMNPKVRMDALKSKKDALTKQLMALKGNYLYHVLQTYDQPKTFIVELRLRFEEKIETLERRTKK